MRFTVYGKVRGSARPRVTKLGTYIPKETMAYRKSILAAFIEAGGVKTYGPVDVRVDVYRELPKSRPKKVRSEPDTFKPDVDNIGKNVLDALNGYAWEDDASVVSLTVVKHPRGRHDELIDVTISEHE